jgi:hypothetical protein
MKSIDLPDCFDDKTAKTRARQLANEHPVELCTVTVRLRSSIPHPRDRGGDNRKPRNGAGGASRCMKSRLEAVARPGSQRMPQLCFSIADIVGGPPSMRRPMVRSPLVIKPEWSRDQSGDLVAIYDVQKVDPEGQIARIVISRPTLDLSSGVGSSNRNIRVRMLGQDGTCFLYGSFPSWNEACPTIRGTLDEFRYPDFDFEEPML